MLDAVCLSVCLSVSPGLGGLADGLGQNWLALRGGPHQPLLCHHNIHAVTSVQLCINGGLSLFSACPGVSGAVRVLKLSVG